MAGHASPSGAALRQRANQLLAVGRAADAVALLREALATDPADSDAHCMLALAFLRLDDAPAALDAATRADPGREWGHRLRSVALLRLGQTREGLAAAREALRLAPELPEALAVLIDAELAAGERAGAREHAETLRRVAPERDLAHQALGRLSLEAHDWAAAESHFRRALEIDPTSWESMNNLAVSLRHQGRPEEAIARFHDAARLQPTNPLVQANLATSIARYAGSGVVALWLGVQVFRFMGASMESPAVRSWIVLAGVASIGWYLYRRQRRLHALDPALQAFYADNRRMTWRTVRIAWGRVAGALVVSLLGIVIVGRVLERYAPSWEPMFLLGCTVAVIGGIIVAIRAGIVPIR